MNADVVVVDGFLAGYFPRSSTPLVGAERAAIDDAMAYVRARVEDKKRKKTYVLGLAVDFAVVAEQMAAKDATLAGFRPSLTEDQLFSKYTLVTRRGSTDANTLTFSLAGDNFGIRAVEEEVADFFHSQGRTKYPSAYVYNTGQWQKYKDLLVKCFSLSSNGRRVLCEELLKYGLALLPRNEFFVRTGSRVRVFEEVLARYPRASPDENGGLTLMAVGFGFVRADRPHLRPSADKVRGGSLRQHRFGDIDCYDGLDLELSVEVKDVDITELNVDSELVADFCTHAEQNHVQGLALVSSITPGARAKVLAKGVHAITVAELLATVKNWDWKKQDLAVQGMLDYLAHIEQSSDAVDRLLAFVETVDPAYISLAFKKLPGAGAALESSSAGLVPLAAERGEEPTQS